MSEALLILKHRGGNPTGVLRVLATGEPEFHASPGQPGIAALARLAVEGDAAWVGWCDDEVLPDTSPLDQWPALLQHSRELLHTGAVHRADELAPSLGFVAFDDPLVLPGPSDRRYPTWLVSAGAGLSTASALRTCLPRSSDLNLHAGLLALGHEGMQRGLFPYSEPALLDTARPGRRKMYPAMSTTQIARLIHRCYGRKWLLFWLVAQIAFNKRLPLGAMARALQRPVAADARESLEADRDSGMAGPHANQRVEVVLPTLGRPGHLRQVILDLAAQTLPPARVIVVSQGEAPSHGQADAPQDQALPFEVDLLHIERVGACRARNLALSRFNGDWCLLLDDDVRLDPEFLRSLLECAEACAVDAVCGAVHTEASPPDSGPRQPSVTRHFASGASLVSAAAVSAVGGFDTSLEGGFGEDYEYGVRLRQAGFNVALCPHPSTLHLKAPTGGFRAELEPPWLRDEVPPRPSPTVLLSRRLHTREMKLGYKFFYWAGRLRAKSWHEWPAELRRVRAEWEAAVHWMNRLRAASAAELAVVE